MPLISAAAAAAAVSDFVHAGGRNSNSCPQRSQFSPAPVGATATAAHSGVNTGRLLGRACRSLLSADRLTG